MIGDRTVPWKFSAFLAIACVSGCAHRKPSEAVRVAILGFEASGGATIRSGNEERPIIDREGIVAIIEKRLLENNVTVVDDAQAGTILAKMLKANETGVHATATTAGEYQPSATHGVFINVQENIGLLTAISLGLIPRSVDLTARLVDVRTGEVRASAHGSAYGSVYSSRAAYRAGRRLADQMAKALALIQEKGRHLRTQDWPTNYQALDTDSSAHGRYSQALIMMSGEYFEEALKALDEAVRKDNNYAALARFAPEFAPLRDTRRFQEIVHRTQVAR